MSWISFAVASVVIVALAHLVIASLAGILSRVPAIAWPLLRVSAALAMLGLAGWLALAPTNTAGPATCVVTEVTTEPLATGAVDVRVRVRWEAAGRKFHLREPMSLGHERGDVAELVARHMNQRVPCYFAVARPSRIFLGDSVKATREQWSKAAAIAVPALALIVLAIVGWRRRSREDSRRAAVWLSSKGAGGVVGIAVILLGMVSGTWLLAGAGGAWMLWLFGREVQKSHGAVSHLTAKLSLVARDPESMMASLHGTRDGAAIEIEETLHQLRIAVELVGWPPSVTVTPTADDTEITGDRVFDRRFLIDGPPAHWRAVLTREIRAALGEVFVAEASRIETGRWHAVYEDDVADGPRIHRDIERALALARLVTLDDTATPHERVLAVARAEPDAAVRAGHYHWLVDDGYPAAAVALVAADDPDATIRAWVRDQVAPPDGAFR